METAPPIAKRHPLLACWEGLRKRCKSPTANGYEHYGGRGITVCERWDDPETGFDAFVADMGPKPTPKHSIDRIDNDGNYEPGNCRWATALEQAANKRLPLGAKERSTAAVLIKFHPDELAAIDRARGKEPRTRFIKRFMAAVVRRIEEQEAGDG